MEMKRIECRVEIRAEKEHIFVLISIWRGLGKNQF